MILAFSCRPEGCGPWPYVFIGVLILLAAMAFISILGAVLWIAGDTAGHEGLTVVGRRLGFAGLVGIGASITLLALTFGIGALLG